MEISLYGKGARCELLLNVYRYMYLCSVSNIENIEPNKIITRMKDFLKDRYYHRLRILTLMSRDCMRLL